MEFEKSITLRRLEPFGVVLEPNTERADVMTLNIETLRELFWKEHLLVLRGFNTFQSSQELSNYCDMWGEISLWPFGAVLELMEQDNPQDHIFDHSFVPLHWDGMYREQVPEYQIFHCVKAPLPGQGGRTTFSNTLLALEFAPPSIRELWSRVTGHYRRRMEFYNSKTVSPIIAEHPHRGHAVLRYNEPHAGWQGRFINPPELNFFGLPPEELADFHLGLKEALYSPRNFYAHEWQSGDVVIADNFTLLHGREAFVSKSPRHLQRVQVHSDPPFQNSGLEFYK